MAEKLISEEQDKTKLRAVAVSKEKTNENTGIAGTSRKRVSSEHTGAVSNSGKGPVSTKQMCKNVESEILSAVKGIQSAMLKQDQKTNSMVNRLLDIEKYTFT